MIDGNGSENNYDELDIKFSTISEIQSKSLQIFFDEVLDLLYIKDETGNRVYCPEDVDVLKLKSRATHMPEFNVELN